MLKGTGGVWHVRADSGETHEASLRGRLKQERGESRKLAVGDRVVLEIDERGTDWAIAEILPRHSKLARREPGAGQGERIVAANVDQVVVVFSAAKPEPHRRMLDRFLVIAEGNSLQSRIVINKIELVDKKRSARSRTTSRPAIPCTSPASSSALDSTSCTTSWRERRRCSPARRESGNHL